MTSSRPDMTEALQLTKRIGYFNPDCKEQPPAIAATAELPSQGQLELAGNICAALNMPLPKECLESYAACYRFIGDNKAEFYLKKWKKPAAAGAGAGGVP